MPERFSRVRSIAREVFDSIRSQIAGSTAAIVAILAASILLLSGIGIALAIYSGSDTAVQTEAGPSQPQHSLVRPVQMQDFRFPRMHLDGPEGDFFRYRDPASAWSREEVQRLWLDLEQEAVDIVTEKNSDLLKELLEMHP